MKGLAVFATFAIIVASGSPTERKPAFLELRSDTFNRTLSAFPFALVRFSGPRIAVADWDKDDLFNDFATDWSHVEELLMGHVDVKEHLDLGRRFRCLDESAWPEIVLFRLEARNGGADPSSWRETRYGGSASSDDLRSFVKAKSGLPMTLPGCLSEFDSLAKAFAASARQRDLVVLGLELRATCCEGSPERKAAADKYLNLIKGALKESSGDKRKQSSYFERERNRLERLLASGKLSIEKARDLKHSVNIVKAFQRFGGLRGGAKDEL